MFIGRVACVILLGTLAGSDARAGASFCQGIIDSNVAFEIRFKRAGRPDVIQQVFRGEKLRRTQVEMQNGSLIESGFQGTFLLRIAGGADVPTSFSYDLPTDRYIWDQTKMTVQGRSVREGVPGGSSFVQTFRMLPDETVAVGPCRVPVKHYAVETASSSLKIEAEAWFSTGLNTPVRTQKTSYFGNGTTVSERMEAASIETGFEPFLSSIQR